MSTPDFEVHRGVVQYSDPATGLSKVRIPALLGADGVVDVPSLGLAYENGFWNVPDVGSSVFVAVSRDRLDFLWLTAVVTPTYRNDTSFVDSLQFDIDANITVESEGLLAWNEDWGTVDIGLHGSDAVLHVGQQVYYYAKNQTGAQIDKGTVVRFDGALGASGHLKMAPFLADGTYPSEYIMGITAHDIPNGDDGYVVHFGAVRGVDTATPGWSAGDVVYASPTVTGGLTSTAPSAPNNIILVAAVVNSHQNNGELFVRPTLAANILNDEGIVYTNLADNDVLAYNSTTGVFENTSSLELTSLTVDGDITYNNNAIISSYGSSTNIDHFWHDDSSTDGLTGTWHFVSDSSYKSIGNSMLEAGGARIPMRRSLSTTSNVTISDRTYAGGYIKMTSTSSRTVTVQSRPAGTYKIGDQITIIRDSTGAVTFAVQAGAGNATIPTIKSRNGDVTIAYRYSAATLICDSNDGTVWYLIGDLT